MRIDIDETLIKQIVSAWGKSFTVDKPHPGGRPHRPSREPRFKIALSGTPSQLQAALPLFGPHSCLRVRTIFVDGDTRADFQIRAQIVSITELSAEALRDIDALLDFTDHKSVVELRRLRFGGKADSLPLVLCMGNRFFDGSGGVSRVFVNWVESVIKSGGGDAVE
jgi:hypothetical protein